MDLDKIILVDIRLSDGTTEVPVRGKARKYTVNPAGGRDGEESAAGVSRRHNIMAADVSGKMKRRFRASPRIESGRGVRWRWD